MAIFPESPRFKRLLLNAILVPLGLMIAVAAVLTWQISHLRHVSTEVEHSDQFIAGASELHRLTIDLETGVRGYLLTGNDDFLQPYQRAAGQVDLASNRLRQTTDDPLVKAQIRDIDERRAAWIAYATPLIEARSHNSGLPSDEVQLTGKRMMDGIRDQFRQLIDRESLVRQSQFEDARFESRLTLAVVAGAAIGGGGVLALLSRSQFLQIMRAYNSALVAANDLNQTLEHRVSERTAELLKRSSELAEANKELEGFSYSISHDLRAPLRHISGFASLLQKSKGIKLPPAEMEHLTTIRDTASLAGRMVDDLLAFSRVGRVSVQSVPVDLNSLINASIRELAPDISNRQIEWEISPLPVILGDSALMKQVLLNLLSNAIKYTGRREKAMIEVGTRPLSASDPAPIDSVASAVIFVRDNGVGFEMAYAGKLFGVFQRLHRAEDFEGTGIGLANVKRIINRFGGNVWAEGQLDCGAAFYFSVPVTRNGDS